VRLLLDTHVLIWLVEGLDDLPPASLGVIDEATRSHGIAASAISFWEVAMLVARGRISLSKPIREWRAEVLAAPGLDEIAVTGAVGIESVQLPGSMHDDPADRIIVATARLEGLKLATRDRRLLGYAEAGHLVAIGV
jgi:PIN domain nuclease of toxin-antitoxin system